uniref:Uncharacterized protein n=1 Tax=uncultured organism MedDCM-OCT-S11-C383 TaxID=743662 RepID=D6PLI4_9ZZZZ|nr:hypothetical protein [uncultured organism MedDCM-OCT-S11-C383]
MFVPILDFKPVQWAEREHVKQAEEQVRSEPEKSGIGEHGLPIQCALHDIDPFKDLRVAGSKMFMSACQTKDEAPERNANDKKTEVG